VLVGGLCVLFPRLMLRLGRVLLTIAGAVLVGGILWAFGWFGTGEDHDGLGW
jgi:hypothetical protein